MGAEWRLTPSERLLAKSERSPDGCLIFTGRITDDGYGSIGYKGQTAVNAHRVAYLEWVGDIPDGMHVDHRCHTDDETCQGGPCIHRRCIEPTHLEPVTPGENTRRGRSFTTTNATKSHCPSGHPYNETNTILFEGRRYCRACKYEQNREYKRRKRAS